MSVCSAVIVKPNICLSSTAKAENVLWLSDFAEGLRRPSCLSGWGLQSYCWCKCARQRLCSGKPAQHLHQRALLHTVDLQSLQILPKPWSFLEPQRKDIAVRGAALKLVAVFLNSSYAFRVWLLCFAYFAICSWRSKSEVALSFWLRI